MKDYKADLLSKLPELKQIEGFPIGTDEDIIELSDPPYYTACPNPYINEFIEKHGKPYDEATDNYHCEPFVGDVSEGKNDPIYNAHSYHTKVPHKAIMKYIEHYTNEGDIVLDGFCGTGMTGVAAQLLNRKAILSDLSPIATFIAYNYNNPVDLLEFKREADKILKEVEKECGWMYETTHYINGKPAQTKGKINYVVWSDVFICPYCKNEYIFYDIAVNKDEGTVLDEYYCNSCNSLIKKSDCENAFELIEDTSINQKVSQKKQKAVLINYYWNKKKFERTLDIDDYKLIEKINSLIIPYWYPINRMSVGNEARRNDKTGITHIHHFFYKRTLYILAAIHAKCQTKTTKLWFFSQLINLSKLNRYRPGVSFPYNPLSGTLYIGSQLSEANVFTAYLNKAERFYKALSIIKTNNFVQNCSVTNLYIKDNQIDYIFTDPPFGDNLQYSELNTIWEFWLKINTNIVSEAVINKSQNKDLQVYFNLMQQSFKEYYRVLKPNRWITVEFHNSKSSVWNAIQEAMTKAGFIIANVAILDKQQGSFKQVTSAGAVKNDLVISAFKPAKSFEERIIKNAGKDFEIEFVKDFLNNLPKRPIIERTEQMLYSKMLAYYVLRGYEVQYNSTTFYSMLRNHFVEEDGLWFNDNQIADYRIFKQEMKLAGKQDGSQGMLTLFVTDEKSAIIWLTNFLTEPKSFSDIHSAFTKLLNKQDDLMPDIKDILQENFVNENDKFRKPSNEEEHNALGEKRQRNLLKQFETLLLEAQKSKKKIKTVRKEALVFGMETYFKNRRFREILEFSKKLDNSIIDNNAEISMFIETAEIEIEGLF